MLHKVLVVDDSPDIHDLVRVGLLGEPLELLGCDDGAEALSTAVAMGPDLILLDVDMPGTDGFAACRQLKADPRTTRIPVVFLSGSASVEVKLTGLEAGAIDYLTKPFDPAELRARVRAALRTKRLMDLLARETENLRAYTEVLRTIAQDAPLEQVQRRLIEMAESEYPRAVAAIVLLRHGGLGLMGPRLSTPLRAAMEEHLVRFTSDLCSALATSGESFGACDVASDARFEPLRSAAAVAGLTTCWYSLVQSGGGGQEVAGMACLFLPGGLRLNSDDGRSFLDKSGSLLSIAVDHCHLTEQLAHRAQHDALTGLPNRALLDERLRRAMAAATAAGRSVGVIFIDVDRFKLINDTMGHLVGDLLLCQLAERIQRAVGGAGELARLGGDEFALVIPDVSHRADAVRVGRRIPEELKTPFVIGGRELHVTASLGLALFPDDGQDTVTLQKNADVAMYRAKHGGRNNLECFDRKMASAVSDRLELEDALRRAVEAGELVLYYQPQLDRAGATVAVESLLRWRHPQLGLVPPDRFIPLAEETGLIVPIGAWVLREASRQGAEWCAARVGGGRMRVAVNVSALQFAQADLVEQVEAALAAHGLPPECLELELTESMLMKTPQDAAAKIARLGALGVKTAIDDFGTGYSSLAYLQRLPVDALKIDRSFVTSIDARALADRNSNDTAVIRAITSMAHSMGKKVVAEGVETDDQRRFLLDLGCDLMQGYLFSRPVPAEQIAGFLATVRAAA